MSVAQVPAPIRGVSVRFPLFDSLRAIAALSVFALHLPFVAGMAADNPLKPYLLQLNVGVAVFFLISGFLLYRPFARARYEHTKAPRASAYGVRRALRIVPAYWLALPFAVLLVGPSGEAVGATHVFSPRGIVSYFGFLQIYDSQTLLGGISAAWTLCVEVTFYAMLPLWALLLARVPWRSRADFVRTEGLGLAALFAVGAAWTSIAALNTDLGASVFVDVTQIQPWLYVLPGYLDHFALGMALAVASVVLAGRPSRSPVLRTIDRAPWAPWVISAVAFVAMGSVANWSDGPWALRYALTHELQGVFAFALLLPAVFGDPDRGFVRRLLGNRFLLWIGLVSYGLYLWHAPLMRELSDHGALDTLGSAGYAAVALALALLVAAASFYGLERHALRLGRRLSHRRRSQDADARMADLARHERSEAGVP